MITIKNEELEFTVNPYGAEGVSLRDVKTGHEYWWHGDPAYWEGHAPILFPAVGGHWNGTYRYEGREYAMPKHGFVRQRLWNVAEEGPDYVSFSYELQPDDLAIYPFPCTVCVDYRLEGRRLKATFTVRNQVPRRRARERLSALRGRRPVTAARGRTGLHRTRALPRAHDGRRTRAHLR